MPEPAPDEPLWRLTDHPDLGWLRDRARDLQRRVRRGDPEALALVARYPPRARVDPASFPLSAAQTVLAQAFGFGNWPRLLAQLRTINALARSPQPTGEALEPAADQLLRLACLTYTDDRAEHWAAADRLLAAQPELATASVWTMAATGRAEDLHAVLAEQPNLARTEGGPHRWPPLLYLTYARLPDLGRPVDAARVLLTAGADPTAGFLWQGLTSPFTALTGVFGGGEQDQPVHRDSLELARLLLEHGADPNDNQALYNRMFTPRDDHLGLLFAYGLGEERPSSWRARLGAHAYPSPSQMIGEQLRWAADHGFVDRVRLLLAHGVDPDARGYHPIYGEQRAYALAVRSGHDEIAELLRAAGAANNAKD